MPRPHIPPQYRKRTVKGRAYAYTYVNGRQLSLGLYGSAESRERFAAIVRHNGPPPTEGPAASMLVVAELCERYLERTQARVDRGEVGGNAVWLARTAIDAACEEHGHLLVDEFKSRALIEIQRRLVKTPCRTNAGRFRDAAAPPTLSRSEVNRRINEIRRIFRWGIAEELVSPEVKLSHDCVNGLRRGMGRETEPRTAAHVDDVLRVAQHLLETGDQRHFGLMLQFLLYTGCRPGEAAALRIEHLRGTPPTHIELRDHKTAKTTGQPRVIPLGNVSRQIIADGLADRAQSCPAQPVFCRVSPTGTVMPLSPNGLLQSVRRACRALACPRFSPYQVRHTSAQLVLDGGGSEAVASALLGHTPGSTVVRTYTKDRRRLAEVAATALDETLAAHSTSSQRGIVNDLSPAG